LHHAAGAVQIASLGAGRFVAMGGVTAAVTSTANVIVADSQGVIATTALPGAQHDAQAANLGGQVYVFGGGELTQYDHILRFDPATRSVTQVGNLPTAQSDVAVTRVGGTAYVVNSGDGTVTPIDLATATTEPRIRGFHHAGPIAISPYPRERWYPVMERFADAAGARGYVMKGSPPEDLLRAIRTVAEGKAFVDPSLSPALLIANGGPVDQALSEREREILQLLAEGLHTEEVARRIGLSVETVKSDTKRVIAKLDADTRTHAVAIALRLTLIE